MSAMKKYYFIVYAILLFTSPLLHAGEGQRLLDKFLNDTQSMTAEFVQTLSTDDGEILQQSSGQFYLQRPGKFRWNYAEPYPQEIVSDGERIWVYDVDLQQVTVQKQSSSLSQTPMALIQGRAQLNESFDVKELGLIDGVHKIKLVSLSKDVDFKNIILGVDKTGLKYMQLNDQFEQTTNIIFDALQSNPQIAQKIFEFIPPEGVDVFGDS